MTRRHRPPGNSYAAAGGRGWRYRHFEGWRLTAAQRRLIGTFAVLAVAAVVAWLISISLPGQPPFRFVAIGITAYDDPTIPPNTGAEQDLLAFRELRPYYPDGVETWENSSNAISLREQLDSLHGSEGQLVVYLSALALADPVGQNLTLSVLTQGATFADIGQGNSPGRLKFDVLLDYLKNSGAKHVLLLLDLNRLPADMRLGLFSNRIKTYVDEAVPKDTRITIVCACDDQQSSRLDPHTGNSLFGQAVVSAFQGQADGWSDAQGKGPKDRRISLTELLNYLDTQVGRKSKPSQTVVRLGWLEDFEVAFLRPMPKPHRKTEEHAGSKAASADPASDPPKSPAENQPPSGESKSAATAETAEPGAAKPDQPGSPAANADEKPAPVALTLSDVWKRKDQLLPAFAPGLPTDSARDLDPSELSQMSGLLWHLKRAAEFERAGLDSLKLKAVSSALALLTPLERQKATGEFEPAGSRNWWNLAVANVLSAEQTARFEAYQSAPETLSVEDRSSLEFLDWLSAQAANLGGNPEIVPQFGAWKKLIDTIAPSENLPPELQFLWEVGQGEQAPGVLDDARFLKSALGIVQAHRDCRRLLTTAGPRREWLRADVQKTLRDLDQAERWLLGTSSVDRGDAQTRLDSARRGIESAEMRARRIDDAFRTTTGIWLRLPYWIQIAALEAEETSSDLVAPASLQRHLDTASDGPPEDLLRLEWSSTSPQESQFQMDVSQLITSAIQLIEIVEQLPKSDLRDDGESFLTAADAAKQLAHRVDNWITTKLHDHNGLSDRRLAVWSACPIFSDELRPRATGTMPQSALSTQRPPDPRWHGIWQGYWTIQLLRLGGLPEKDLKACCSLWVAWCQVVLKNSGDIDVRLAHQDAALAAQVRRCWEQLSKSQLWRASLILPMNKQPNMPTKGPSRRDVWQELLTEDLQRRQSRPRSRPYCVQLLRRMPKHQPISEWSREPPKLKIDPEQLEVQADGTGHIAVSTLNSPSETAQPLKLWWHATGLELLNDGSTDKLLDLNGKTALTLRFKSQNRVDAPRQLTLALLSSDGERWPYDFQTVPVERVTDLKDFKFQLTNAANGLPIAQVTEGDEIRFFLPPQGLTPEGMVSLGCDLICPSSDRLQQGTLKVFRRTSSGTIADAESKQGLKPITEVPVEISPRETKVKLTLSASPAADAPKADNPKASDPTKPAIPPLDVQFGMVFELTLADGRVLRKTLVPTFWSADRFIETPDLSFDQNSSRLKVTVKTKPRPSTLDHDPLLPEQIPATMRVPDELFAASDQKSLNSDALTDSQEFWLKLPPESRSRFESREFDVTLDVAGIPHAYRGRRSWGAAESRDPKLNLLNLRLVQPTLGEVPLVDSREPFELQLQLQLNHAELDAQLGRRAKWALSCEWQSDTAETSPVPLKSWPLFGSYLRVVELLNLQNGALNLKVDTRDYALTEKELPKTIDRGQIRVWLSREDVVVEEQSLRLGIHDSKAALLKVDWVKIPASPHPVGTPLSLSVSHLDAVAGIRKVQVWIDVNQDDKIDPTADIELAMKEWKIFDPDRKAWIDQESETMFVIPVKVLKDKLAKLPAADLDRPQTLLCVATNGDGIDAQTDPKLIQFRFPPKTEPKKPTTGSIELLLGATGKKKTGSISGPSPKTIDTNSDKLLFDELEPGEYEIKVRRYGGAEFTKKVTVQVGKTTPVTVR